MDSLTQIVLGAACGEAVLGRKIGNRALLFGAIAGTIPDLDVFVGRFLYSNEIQAMAFHRGFMHSIWFAIIGAFVFGWITFKLYDKGKRHKTTIVKDWIKLFFWALLTHPILDCFTPYGTQLFAPISNYRVAFNAISVADPLYTVPFLIGMIVVMFYSRTHHKRKLWLKIGVGISSFYLLFTVINKWHINSVFLNSLKKQAIAFDRFQTQPTLFNNILWYGVAETETDFYLGFYSLLDKDAEIKDWKKISKQHQLIPLEDINIQTLMWFSNGYYTVRLSKDKGVYNYIDLRYPLLDPENELSSLFTFTIFEINGTWDMKNSGPNFEENVDASSIFRPMIIRLKGI